MSGSDRSPALTWLGIAISVVSIAAVIWWATRQGAPRLPSGSAEWLAMVGAIALYGVNTLLRGERWRHLLIRDGGVVRRRDAYGLTTVGYMGNNVLPARAGDLLRIFLMAPRAQTGRRNVVGTLLSERVLDVVVLVALFFALAGTVAGGVELPEVADEVWIALAAAAAVVVVALAALAFSDLERLRRWLAYLRPVFGSLRDLRGRNGIAMLALTALIWALETVIWWACAAAVDFSVNGAEALYLVALAGIFSLIPSGPGYAGTQDAAIVIGARSLGASGSVALSYLLMVRFVVLVPITIAGLVILIVGYGGLGPLRRAEHEVLST